MPSAITRLLHFIGNKWNVTIRFSFTGYRKPMPPKYRHFTEEEVEGLNEEFCALLDRARHVADVPFVITSGLRSPEKNNSVIGAVPDSAHLKGLAVDLRVSNSQEVSRIVQGCIAMGIERIGIYVDKNMQPVHLHVDVDPEKEPKECIFIKQEASP